MIWLADTHEITGGLALIVAFLIGGSVAVVMGQFQDLANQRWHQARRDACHESARARAAEHPRYGRKLHWTDRPIEPARPVITMGAPTVDQLDAWDAEVDGLPWGYAMNQALADVVDDPGSCTPKLSPRAPVTTARLRRMVGVAA